MLVPLIAALDVGVVEVLVLNVPVPDVEVQDVEVLQSLVLPGDVLVILDFDVEELGVLVLDVGMLDVEGLEMLVLLVDVLAQLVEARDVEILKSLSLMYLYCWRTCWCCWLKCGPYLCWMCLCLMFSYLMLKFWT